VHLQVYPHVLESRDEVVEWVRGTLLTDYQKRLTPDLFDTFVAEYRRRLAGDLPDERPFFYPFKRILLWAKAA
jgi:trans-aconitate 2-methyltransferase